MRDPIQQYYSFDFTSSTPASASFSSSLYIEDPEDINSNMRLNRVSCRLTGRKAQVIAIKKHKAEIMQLEKIKREVEIWMSLDHPRIARYYIFIHSFIFTILYIHTYIHIHLYSLFYTCIHVFDAHIHEGVFRCMLRHRSACNAFPDAVELIYIFIHIYFFYTFVCMFIGEHKDIRTGMIS